MTKEISLFFSLSPFRESNFVLLANIIHIFFIIRDGLQYLPNYDNVELKSTHAYIITLTHTYLLKNQINHRASVRVKWVHNLSSH